MADWTTRVPTPWSYDEPVSDWKQKFLMQKQAKMSRVVSKVATLIERQRSLPELVRGDPTAGLRMPTTIQDAFMVNKCCSSYR